MLRIAKIVTLIFMIIGLLGLLAFAGLAALSGIFAIFFIGYLLFFILWFIVDLLVYLNIGQIQSLVDQGMYSRAKEKTLVWMILGLIFAGLIPGILLIIAYTRFDPVIEWQRSMGQMPQAQMAWGQPPPQGGPPQAWSAPPAAAAPPPQTWSTAPPAAAAPAPAPAPMAAPAPPAAPTCPRCGKPATWIAQYNRWYCYTDAQYL